MNFTLKKVRNKVALAIASALMLSAVVAATPSTPANATPNPSTECVVNVIHHDEVSHQEYKYSKVIKGQESSSHAEYRFRTRTITYGEIEHKYVKSTYGFVDGGTTNVNGHTVSGHWVGGNANAWRAIPDSVINAVWGSGGIPSQYIGGSEANPKGSVNLNTYGGPNVNVQYYASVESNPSGYTDWGPWSGWSKTNPGAGTDTKQVESEQVSDNNGTADKTVFYLSGGGQSDSNTDANWTKDAPGAPWTKIDERKIVDKKAWDEEVYGPCPQDATATATVKDAASCLNPSSVEFALANATWDAPADLTVGTHTRSATAVDKHLFGNGTKHLTVSYTIADADPSLCPQTAVATVVTDQTESCLAASTVTFDLVNATWDAPADLSVGTHTRNATADKGTLFTNGTRHLTVTYTIVDADPKLCPLDASASVSVTQQEGCLVGTEVAFAIANADWDAAADLTVGTHTRSATAHAGVNFPDGTQHLTVTYTIKAADPALCPQDATASVSIDTAATCTASETVKLNLVNATADSALVQTVGTHSVPVTAIKGHNFSNGTAHASVSYTVKAADPKLCKPTGGIETGDDSAFFGANDSGLQLNGGSIAGIIAILVFGTLAILWIARRRNSAV